MTRKDLNALAERWKARAIAAENRVKNLESKLAQVGKELAESNYKHSAEYHNKLHGPGMPQRSTAGMGSYYDDDRA